MVHNGGHSLQIVDAVTKQPLREFRASDGTIWVEGKHGNEFCLRVAGPPGIFTICGDIKVDGTDVGFQAKCGVLPQYTLIGMNDGRGNATTMQFARVEKTGGTEHQGKQIGVVSATWFDARIYHGPDIHQNTPRNAPNEDIAPSDAAVYSPEDEKTSVGALKTVVGSQVLRKAPAPAPPVPVLTNSGIVLRPPIVEHWERGLRRVTLKIYYCEAAGLVARKIAKSSEFWAAAAVTPASQASTESNKKRPAALSSRTKKKKKGDAKPEPKTETVDLTGSSPASAPPGKAMSYDDQIKALKKRVRDGSLTLDDYQAKKAVLDDIYGDD